MYAHMAARQPIFDLVYLCVTSLMKDMCGVGHTHLPRCWQRTALRRCPSLLSVAARTHPVAISNLVLVVLPVLTLLWKSDVAVRRCTACPATCVRAVRGDVTACAQCI